MRPEDLSAGVRPPVDPVGRIRAEYLEMPGLSLTLSQAQRLWGLGPDTCRIVLESLVGAKFLTTTRRGCYVRAHGRATRQAPLRWGPSQGR